MAVAERKPVQAGMPGGPWSEQQLEPDAVVAMGRFRGGIRDAQFQAPMQRGRSAISLHVVFAEALDMRPEPAAADIRTVPGSVVITGASAGIGRAPARVDHTGSRGTSTFGSRRPVNRLSR